MMNTVHVKKCPVTGMQSVYFIDNGELLACFYGEHASDYCQIFALAKDGGVVV